MVPALLLDDAEGAEEGGIAGIPVETCDVVRRLVPR